MRSEGTEEMRNTTETSLSLATVRHKQPKGSEEALLASPLHTERPCSWWKSTDTKDRKSCQLRPDPEGPNRNRREPRNSHPTGLCGEGHVTLILVSAFSISSLDSGHCGQTIKEPNKGFLKRSSQEFGSLRLKREKCIKP